MTKKRKFRLRPDIKGAEIVLRVPYVDHETYYHHTETRDVAVPLTEFIEAILSNIDGTAFGREDSVSLRLGFSQYWYMSSVPDEIEVEADVDDDD